jgi:hypothetical protein
VANQKKATLDMYLAPLKIDMWATGGGNLRKSYHTKGFDGCPYFSKMLII